MTCSFPVGGSVFEVTDQIHDHEYGSQYLATNTRSPVPFAGTDSPRPHRLGSWAPSGAYILTTQEHDAQRTSQKTLAAKRDAAVEALRNQTRGVIYLLRGVLDGNDPRWSALGLNAPKAATSSKRRRAETSEVLQAVAPAGESSPAGDSSLKAAKATGPSFCVSGWHRSGTLFVCARSSVGRGFSPFRALDPPSKALTKPARNAQIHPIRGKGH